MALRKAKQRPHVAQHAKTFGNRLALGASADVLGNLQPILLRTFDALRTDTIAQLLEVDPAQVSRWKDGSEAPSDTAWWRILNLHDVLTRILRVLDREAAELWLVGSEPLLGGARPIDVLAQEGAAPLIRCIDGIAQGAHA